MVVAVQPRRGVVLEAAVLAFLVRALMAQQVHSTLAVAEVVAELPEPPLLTWLVEMVVRMVVVVVALAVALTAALELVVQFALSGREIPVHSRQPALGTHN